MKVLVVEDEPRIAADISAALKGSGMVVDLATDGEDAWFKGDTESYDAAILDLGLPKLDGLTVLKRWRTGGRRFPVLVLTARGVWTERVDGINAGADDYLPKPFEMEELLARLRALLRRSAGQAAPVLNAGLLSLDTRQMRISLVACRSPCRRWSIGCCRISCIMRAASCRRRSLPNTSMIPGTIGIRTRSR